MIKLTSTNPAKNYKVLGNVEISTEKEIQNKVKAARSAKDNWKSQGVKGRVELLKQVVKDIIKRKEEIAILATREIGMPISQSLFDVDSAVNYFNWYLKNAEKYLSPEITFEDKQSIHKVFYEPTGVTAVIVPWNFPISNFVWGVIQNLIAGNTVIFKHSEECPIFGKLLEKIMDNANLPNGVFAQIYGDGKTGDFLVHQNIDLIYFTGSSKIGKYLYQVGAKKFIKVFLELGGSSPGIIFEDADIDSVLNNIYSARFDNCGQMCDAIKRLIVHKNKYNEVINKLKKLLVTKKVGDPENPSTDIGPLVAKRQLELLKSQVQNAIDNGAIAITGGKCPKSLEGAYYEPTILTNVNKNMKVWQEEIFGPVLPIVTFKTEEEAIELGNDTKYGLGSYIFTQDKKKALRVASKINAGMISVNNVYYLMPCSPFGGYKESGLGREHGKYGLRELSQIKLISIEK